MKRIIKFSVMALAVATTGLLNSCTKNEALVPDENVQTIQLLKAPDVLAYSGKNVWGSTLSTRAGSNPSFVKWQSDRNWENMPENPVPEDEISFVLNYIKEHPDEGYDVCDLTDYYIQNIGSSKANYDVYFMNGDQVHHSTNIVGGNQMNYLVINGYHFDDYNATFGSFGRCTDMPLTDITYHDSYGDLTIENAYKFYYIEYNGKVNLYLCFDYRTSKYDNGQMTFDGDGVYNDWVVKISPADGSTLTIPNEGDDDPENPGEDPEEPETPVTPAEPTDEVEINLSVNEHKDYLETKLSIHVRAATDVEVFIPIEAQYYVQKDDMAIVGSHLKEEVEMSGNLVYGGNKGENEAIKTTTIDYNINGNLVKLTVSYEMNGIRITTDGINEAVIEFCREKFHDGITFEVWNYFNNDAIKRNKLRDDLVENKATVEFLDKTPDLYVNAFNKAKKVESIDEETGEKVYKTDAEGNVEYEQFAYDCPVDIDDSQKGEYNTPVTGKHLNGSPYNQLYLKKAEAE